MSSMHNPFSAVRGDRGDGLGSDSEGEGRQDPLWGKRHSYNRGSVDADSDYGTPQPQRRTTATASQWASSVSPSSAQNTNWQPTPTISPEVPQVDPIPVVDRPLQPPKPKRTRVKGGRKNGNANTTGGATNLAAGGSMQPIIPPSLVPATPQSYSKHRRQPDDPSTDLFQFPELSMPAASSSFAQKKYPTSLSRTHSGAREPSRDPRRNPKQSSAIDYSLMDEEAGSLMQHDFSYDQLTSSQPHAKNSDEKRRPSPLPLNATPFASGHRGPTSDSQCPAPAVPSTHASAQGMPPPPSPTRSEVKRKLLTILIEDKRSDGMELAEIRVPLQPRAETLWVKAAQVVENLQSGPSRIDGPCRVHAMRGHFRQTFLRIEHDGREIYDEQQSLQVVEDGRGKTLSIYIESIPVPRTSTPVYSRVSHEPTALHLTTDPSSQMPLTPHSSGPSPLLAHTQQKRRRMASARDISAAPESTIPDYSTDYGHHEVPEQGYAEPRELYESSLPSSSRKRVKSNAQMLRAAPSPYATTPAQDSARSQPGRARSESRAAKTSQPTPTREGDTYGAPSPQPSASRHAPAHRQLSADFDAPPTISALARAAKSNGNTLGMGLPSVRMPPSRGAQGQALSAVAPTPEVVEISSRESSPERGHGPGASPSFSQASAAADFHAPTSSTFSPAPLEPSQPPDDFNPLPSPAPAQNEPEPEPEPLAQPSPPPVDPAIAHLLPLDISPTTYVASEMPTFADNIDQMMAARLTNTLRMDGFGFKDFQEKLTAGQALSNERALHWYRWVHEKVQKYANETARAPAECERRLVEPKHVLAAMQVTEEWYGIVRETLSMMMAYGPGGQRGANPRVVQAATDKKPRDARLGVVRWTHLLLLLREVHDEWSRSQNAPRE
ncbi:unnamed protein product [Peniophora sp. CBMAI 1063]|nr:unnamed protein product [Peniophora sp. CBMAI 1063]